MQKVRCEAVERVLGGRRVHEQNRTLPEIVDHQRRQHEGEPRDADRPRAEMAEIGVHRLAAGDGEKGRAEHRESDMQTGMRRELDRAQRIDRGEDLRRLRDAAEAEGRQYEEPHQHHRPEDLSDEGRAPPLHEEEPDEDRQCDRHDEAVEGRGIDPQPLDRRQDRDRRRDRAVAVEQGGADEADHQQQRLPRAGLGVAGAEQRQHRHDAALAAIVGAQDQHRVFQRDDEDQRPQDQRDGAGHRDGRWRAARARGAHRLLERVERARTDVAVDDAEGGDEKPRAEAAARARIVGSRQVCSVLAQGSAPEAGPIVAAQLWRARPASRAPI